MTVKYVIGIDGGGTKTSAVLADLKGKILAQVKTGSSNIDKIGFEEAIDNIAKALNQVSQKCQKNKIAYANEAKHENKRKAVIAFIYIGLAGQLERDKKKKQEIKNQLLRIPELSWISPENILVEADQLPAFRLGVKEKQGILLIAGTGSIAIGWGKKGKEVIAGGWEYLLGDDGSGFWIGQKALRAVCCSVDGLIPQTLLRAIIFKRLKIKTEGDLIRKIYQPTAVQTIASLAPLAEIAAEKGDKAAKHILLQAGNELAIRANIVIKKLNFKNKKFPIVLVGSVFKSKTVLAQVKKEIKKLASKADFIRPKQKPVIGAVKLAIEQIL